MVLSSPSPFRVPTPTQRRESNFEALKTTFKRQLQTSDDILTLDLSTGQLVMWELYDYDLSVNNHSYITHFDIL